MSNIIKERHLILAEQPRLLDLLGSAEVETPEKEKVLPVSSIDLEKEQLQKLKLESRQILAETENMVLELLEKARSDARTIINDAQEEAGIIRAQVYEEAGTMRQQAQDEGYRQGLKQAQAEIEADRQAALEQSQVLMEEARQTKVKTIDSMERDIAQLVMAISKKVIAGEVVTNPQVIVNIVRQAISFLDNPENITVYVNPHDLERALAAMEAHELEEGHKVAQVEVRSADRVQAGGCLIESDIGRVDARLETREASVERAILEVVSDE